MATRKIKFKVSIKELSFEFEGNQEAAQEVQEDLQQTLGGLMNTQSRVLNLRDESSRVIDAHPAAPKEAAIAGSVQGDVHPSAADGNGEKPKQPRQRRGKGVSVVNLLRDLKKEGFFLQARLGNEAQARLKDKGHTVQQSNVLSQLQRLVQLNELFREYNSTNVYVYKDSPFDESPRSQSPTDQLAE